MEHSQDLDIASKKESIIDVRCQDQEDAQYIVGMQVAESAGFEK